MKYLIWNRLCIQKSVDISFGLTVIKQKKINNNNNKINRGKISKLILFISYLKERKTLFKIRGKKFNISKNSDF